MLKRKFALALCLVLALSLIPAAVSMATNVSNKHLYASVGENVHFSCKLATNDSIGSNDATALRSLGLSGAVNGKKLTVSGTAAKEGSVRMQVSDVVLNIRVSGPETPPKTGDENKPLLFAGLAAVSLLGLAVTVKRSRA